MCTWMKQCLYLFFNYFMHVLCLHDEEKRLPIGKQSSRSTLLSSLLTSPTHIHLYSHEYEHANICSLTQICTRIHMRMHPHEHEHIHAHKKKYRKEANPLWEHISIPGIPLPWSYAEATDVMKTWEETGFHPQRRCHFLRLKGGQESENMLLTFLKSS